MLGDTALRQHRTLALSPLCVALVVILVFTARCTARQKEYECTQDDPQQCIEMGNTATTTGLDRLAHTLMWVTVRDIRNASMEHVKAGFFPYVDEFAQAMIRDSGELLFGIPDSLIKVSIGDFETNWVHYSTGTTYVPYYQVIVSIVDGDIVSVDWFDNCLDDCQSEAACITGFCAAQYPEGATTCVPTAENDCNIKIYVGWIGNTADKRICTSSNYFISNFRKFSSKAIKDEARRIEESFETTYSY